MIEPPSVTTARQSISSLQRQRVQAFLQITTLQRQIDRIDRLLAEAKQVIRQHDLERSAA
jgi:hypothetical protein